MIVDLWQAFVLFGMGLATPALTRWLMGHLAPLPPRPAPYDWGSDQALLTIWEWDATGEVLSVIPQSWVVAAELETEV